MVKYLEDLLYKKTEDSQSNILYAQWKYDKQVIPSALEAVSALFPHYSLHNESHSITIINNIVRVLGRENIEKLSAIDIWLILEASYSHDIGMVVSGQELVNSLNSKKFIEFFKELTKDKKNGLFEFANQYKVVDDKIQYKSDFLNLELHDGIKFILAEYFRRLHSDRSQEIISKPDGEIQIASPRGVIPQRIFKILGDICASHTKNFSEVMRLPFCEVGIDMDDSHPRFIACLLRIGDLLDLDNNRFSDVMLRTLSKIPVDTLNHKSKHLSIESFRVDREIIEVSANCKDYNTANITQHWFNYLNSEISNQMINWNNIVPFKELGYLPTIGNLKVELQEYDYIDGKNKPKFTVDTDKALALLQGAGLYEGAYQCIREILQNAVDATLIRIWLEFKDEKDFSSPQSSDFKHIASNFPITININEKDVLDGMKNWSIQITDRGTGISSIDLRFLMNTGSSTKNIERSRIIDSMPAWMRPSGTFGIGFQSIFMLTDLVTIETKSYFNEEYQTIELNSPNSEKDGDILIKKKKTTHSIKPGSTIKIIHKTKAIPERYTVKGEHKNASRIAHNYDPFSHESLDIELGKIFDEIFDFAHKCPFPIALIVNGNVIETGQDNLKQFDFYDDLTALELKMHLGQDNERWNALTYYKNQKAENNHRTLKFIGFEINIHKDKASDVLTLNRNKIRPEYNTQLWQDFYQSAFRLMTNNFSSLFTSNDDRIAGSMFLNYYGGLESVKEFDIKPFDQWEKLKIIVDGKSHGIKKLLNSTQVLKLVYDNRLNFQLGDLYHLDKKELSITLRGSSPSFDFTDFFLFKAKDYFTSISKTTNPEKGVIEVYFTKQSQSSPISDDDLIIVLKNLKKGYFSARAIIPCTNSFFDLRINDDAHESYVYHYQLDANIYLPYPKMLSPFISKQETGGKSEIVVELNEKVYDWVFRNRYNSHVTLDSIKDAYKRFISSFDLDELNKEEKKENIKRK